MLRRSESILLLCAVLAVGSVGVALVLQHFFDMAPCAWCTFQRLIYLLVGGLALAGWLARRSRATGVSMSALAVVAAAGGLWAALHQHLVASQSESCVFTFADRTLMALRLDESLPWLFEPTASCSEANAPLLGLPFALWSAALFALLALLAARAALLARAGGPPRMPERHP
ncbi:MAG: disulfide bond formation protein B [Burkholderiales bacterium]|nr:MAG: disulfide bond formation protein B [Burkholderiales bacterium]